MMASPFDDGGPAFPMHPDAVPIGADCMMRPEGRTLMRGMTLRDWLAGQALPAVIKQYAEANGGIGADHLLTNCPIHAYRIADAMLKQRQERGAP